MRVYDEWLPVFSACDCDIEGTVTNTTCDTVTGQCMCVNDNVTGRRCSKCLSNTEGLYYHQKI